MTSSEKAIEAAACAIRSGRGCDGDVPCAFCNWGPDELTKDFDETGCVWLARAALTAASAVDGDYNAGVEDAAKLAEERPWGGKAFAAKIRKLKRG